MKSWALLLFTISVALVAQTPQAPPQTTEQIEEHAKKLCTLQGVVFNEFNQTPLKKAKVTLKPVPGSASSSPYSVTTENDGKFTLEKVEAGRYTLFADKDGFVRGNYGERRPMGLGITLQLKESDNLKDLTIKLTTQGALMGRIQDADGEPVRGVYVYVLRYQVMLGRKHLVPAAVPVTTDDRGQYRVSSLTPARYYLAATSQTLTAILQANKAEPDAKKDKAPEEGFALTYYPNSPDVAGAAPIDLKPGTEEIKLDMSVQKVRVFRISGKVVNAVSNEPMKGVVLTLSPGQGENMQSVAAAIRVVQAESGEFEFSNIPAGPYTLAAVSQALQDPMAMLTPVTITDQNLEGVVLALGGGSDVPVVAKLEGAGPDGQIPGATKDAKPISPTGTRVLLRLRENPVVGMSVGTIDKDGKALLKKLSAERYVLTLLTVPDGIYLKSARLGPLDVLESGLDTRSAPANGSLDLLFAPTTAEFTGIVQNDKGDPVSGAIVTLIAKRTDLFRSATADQNGNVKIGNLAPAEYQAFAWEDLEGDNAEDAEFRNPFNSRAVKLSISESTHKNQSLTLITRETMEQAQAGR